MINAKIIEDSLSRQNIRLTTMQLCYPRFIHSEFMTHRMFSRNASSSRAIPVAKMISQVWNQPAMPVHWGANQAGMQAASELTGLKLWMTQAMWRTAAKAAASLAWVMDRCGAHKQVANRIMEPFQLIQVIVTATEWDNFFALRAHPDAQPEIQTLAQAMQDAMAQSNPKILEPGEYHLPYIRTYDREGNHLDVLLKASAARCARVSYLTHDGKKSDITKDVALYERLVGSIPLHASPVEHQATPDHFSDDGEPCSPLLHGNFRGWIQARKIIERTL